MDAAELPPLSSNPCLRDTPLPTEDLSDNSVTLRRGGSVKNNRDRYNSEIPLQLQSLDSGDKDYSGLPFLPRRGSSEAKDNGETGQLRRGSADKDICEIPVQLRRGSRRGSVDAALIEGKFASWGYCGSHVLKARPLDRISKIDINIPENVETKDGTEKDETEKDESSQSSAKIVGNKDDSIKNGSPPSN